MERLVRVPLHWKLEQICWKLNGKAMVVSSQVLLVVSYDALPWCEERVGLAESYYVRPVRKSQMSAWRRNDKKRVNHPNLVYQPYPLKIAHASHASGYVQTLCRGTDAWEAHSLDSPYALPRVYSLRRVSAIECTDIWKGNHHNRGNQLVSTRVHHPSVLIVSIPSWHRIQLCIWHHERK